MLCIIFTRIFLRRFETSSFLFSCVMKHSIANTSKFTHATCDVRGDTDFKGSDSSEPTVYSVYCSMKSFDVYDNNWHRFDND